LKRCDVLQNKVTTSVVVDALNLVVYAISVSHECGARDLFIIDECVVAKIVGSNPHAIDRAVGGDVEELGSILDELAVSDEGWDLVLLDGREGGIDGREEPRRDVIGADSAADRVVVQVGSGVLFDVFSPDSATICGSIVLGRSASDSMSLSPLLTTGSTQPTGGGAPILLMK